MRISILTILLIIFTLTTLPMFFMYQRLLHMQDDFCNEIKPKNILGSSDAEYEAWKSCFFSRQDLHIKYGLTMFASIVLIFLTILSWKFDGLKIEREKERLRDRIFDAEFKEIIFKVSEELKLKETPSDIHELYYIAKKEGKEDKVSKLLAKITLKKEKE